MVKMAKMAAPKGKMPKKAAADKKAKKDDNVKEERQIGLAKTLGKMKEK